MNRDAVDGSPDDLLAELLPGTVAPTLLCLYWVASREVAADLNDLVGPPALPPDRWLNVWG